MSTCDFYRAVLHMPGRRRFLARDVVSDSNQKPPFLPGVLKIAVLPCLSAVSVSSRCVCLSMFVSLCLPRCLAGPCLVVSSIDSLIQACSVSPTRVQEQCTSLQRDPVYTYYLPISRIWQYDGLCSATICLRSGMWRKRARCSRERGTM